MDEKTVTKVAFLSRLKIDDDKISSTKDATKLIKEDSTSQKSTCSSDITKLENHLISKCRWKYG